MENRFLLDMSVKYGLEEHHLAKMADMIHQCGIVDLSSDAAKKVGTYLCEMKMMEMPAEEIIEEMRKKGFLKD